MAGCLWEGQAQGTSERMGTLLGCSPEPRCPQPSSPSPDYNTEERPWDTYSCCFTYKLDHLLDQQDVKERGLFHAAGWEGQLLFWLSLWLSSALEGTLSMPVNGSLLDLLCLDWERGLSIPGCSFLTHPLDLQGQFLHFPVGTEAHGLCACWAPGPPGCSCLL